MCIPPEGLQLLLFSSLTNRKHVSVTQTSNCPPASTFLSSLALRPSCSAAFMDAKYEHRIYFPAFSVGRNGHVTRSWPWDTKTSRATYGNLCPDKMFWWLFTWNHQETSLKNGGINPSTCSLAQMRT